MSDGVKDFVIALILAVVIMAPFNIGLFQEDISPGGKNFRLVSLDSSGKIIPGGGAEPVEVVTRFEASATEIHASSESATETESKTDFKVNVITDIKTEGNKMVDIVVSFWHGVAAVLIGETAALMIVIACRKMRIASEIR